MKHRNIGVGGEGGGGVGGGGWVDGILLYHKQTIVMYL